jgi:hypothetical protein
VYAIEVYLEPAQISFPQPLKRLAAREPYLRCSNNCEPVFRVSSSRGWPVQLLDRSAEPYQQLDWFVLTGKLKPNFVKLYWKYAYGYW